MTILIRLSILLFVFSIGNTSLLKANNTEPNEVILQVEGLSILCSEGNLDFNNVVYHKNDEIIEFSTAVIIKAIQIVNAKGELEFFLPVESKKVNINKSLFGEGEFKLGFILEGSSQPCFSKVIIKD